MLIDRAEVVLKAGRGGNGRSSFRASHKGPDGGNGGRGGNLYVLVSSDLTLLNQFSEKKEFAAQNGFPGEKSTKSGKKGIDFELVLPVGTSIIDRVTGNFLYDLNQVGERILLCQGGEGGWGNREFRSSTKTTPVYAEKGKEGQKLDVILSLKLIADFGLIGLPNSGKSSLLNELTHAHAPVANYAFTTLSPNLGVFNGKVIADIPGLIEGASEGKGLGIGFLKHIEKVKVLIHCIAADSSDIERDYHTVRSELGKFNPKLLKNKEIILLTKSDLVTVKNGFQDAQYVSIYNSASIQKVKDLLNQVI